MDSIADKMLPPYCQMNKYNHKKVSSISVVIPALNEQDSIGTTVANCIKTLQEMQLENFEVIVVDDCSQDCTGEIASKHGAVVLRHPDNGGYGRSLKDGILSARYDTIIILDADGTYPVDAIHQMVKEYCAGFNLVVGRRKGKHYRQSLVKMPMRRILKFLVEFASGSKILDINSGLRVFSRSEIIPYFNHLCDTFSFTTSQTLAYLMTGKYLSYVDISYGARIGRTKVRILRDSLRTLQYIILAILYYNPIKIFMLMSASCLLVGILSAAFGMIIQVMAGYYIGIGCVLLSVLIFCLGLLAEQIRQLLLRGKL